MAALVLLKAPSDTVCLMGQHIELKQATLLVGSSADSAGLFLEGGGVSPDHAAITFHHNGYYIHDNGSSIGTYLNGGQVLRGMPQLMRHEDVLSFGGYVFVVDLLWHENRNKPSEFAALQLPTAQKPAASAMVDVGKKLKVQTEGIAPEIPKTVRDSLIRKQKKNWQHRAGWFAAGALAGLLGAWILVMSTENSEGELFLAHSKAPPSWTSEKAALQIALAEARADLAKLRAESAERLNAAAQKIEDLSHRCLELEKKLPASEQKP